MDEDCSALIEYHHEDSEVIVFLFISVQKNMHKIVLEEYYDEKMDHSANEMQCHILTQIEDKDDQIAASRRWEALKKEIDWDPCLVNILAHGIWDFNPSDRALKYFELTEARIKRAKLNLEVKGCFSEEMDSAVDKLTDMWKQTNTKLQQKRAKKSSRKRTANVLIQSSVVQTTNNKVDKKQYTTNTITPRILRNKTSGKKSAQLLEDANSTGKSHMSALMFERKSFRPTEQSRDHDHATKRSKSSEAKVDSSAEEIKQDPGFLSPHDDYNDAKNEKEKTLKQKLHQKEEELRQKNEEIEKLKSQQNLENQDLKARIEQLEEEVKLLKSELEQVKSELKELKSELEQVKLKSKESEESSLKINFGSMCDKMQKNFYQYVFYPHDFSQYEVEIFQARYIVRDIDEGNYGLTSRKHRRKAKKEWERLQKDLGWDKEEHVRGIKELKRMRASSAHPTITREMEGKLKEGLKVLSDIHKVKRAKEVIDIWSKSEQLLEEKMNSATSHAKQCATRPQK